MLSGAIVLFVVVVSFVGLRTCGFCFQVLVDRGIC